MRNWMMGAAGLACVGITLACGGGLGGLGDGDPLYGSATLGPGLTEVEVRAGGTEASGNVVGVPSHCVGYLAPAQPDYQFELSQPGGPLQIGACSDSDTALVIRTPSGTIECIDDTEGTNPVWIESASSRGTYDVWVATYSQGSSSSAKLRITDSQDSVCSPVNWDGPAGQSTRALPAGFARLDVSLNADAEVPASGIRNARGSCVGFIRESGPSARFTMQSGGGPLAFASCSGSDTTLVVRGPDGTILCDDDTEGTNPVVRVAAAAAGDYAVFVGAYSQGTRPPATLTLSEGSGPLCAPAFIK